MIAEAQAAGAFMGYVTMVAVYSGIFVLIHIVVRQMRSNPLLPKHPRPFRRIDPAGLALVAVGVFFAQQLCAILVVGKSYRGTSWSIVGILLALNIGVAAYLVAVRPVMRPRGRARIRVAQGLLIAWASLPVVFGLLLLVMRISGDPQQQDSVTYMTKRGEGWQYLAVFAVLVAPLLEEIVFRGLLYPAIRARFGPAAALIATSALFGFSHEIGVVAPLAAFGLFLGFLVERTGSILPCIVAHAAFNGLTVAQVVVMK